ncbi:unnamed protein product [Mytilus coruscus]|uniref:Exonuclease domain-containing protein n=1 Tax=Mytilus coruscus TaxID=42192 RepID=A0A6J8BV77_MYTCO|nr:unnamed protein product [Mytilus coruscus]
MNLEKFLFYVISLFKGHASMIGLKTGKVMDYAYKSRSCKVCEVHAKRKDTVPAHAWCRNWKGTSNGMEPDMAVEMTHNLNDSGCQIKVFHADNDSTTTSRLKVHFENLEKKDDQNHVKKGFSKKVYELSKKYKELKHPDVIPYLVRCFMYAIKENEGSTDDLRKVLNRIVPHVSGDHSLCTDMKWCTYKDDPVNFKPIYYESGGKYEQEIGDVKGKPENKHLKERRIENKKNKKTAQLSSSVKEGTTYAQETEVNDNVCDIQQIPSPLTLSNSDQYIVFDLETTSLSRNSDITQLAAVSGSTLFQRYIMPRCDISNEASKITELFSQKLQSNCEKEDLHHVNFNNCRLSLKPLVDKKVINAAVCFKLARGINVTHLKLANSRDVNGIKLILTENSVNSRYASSIIGHLPGFEG